MKTLLKQLRQELEVTGLLLLTDAKLPSLTSIVAGQPVKGSWWGHPQGNRMYNVCNELMNQPDVLVMKLINKKVTFIHQQLWDDLVAIGAAEKYWQIDKLPVANKNLFKLIQAKGEIRADDPGLKKSAAEIGKVASKLEERLLIYSASIHTESGKHVRLLKSWKNVMRAKKWKPKKTGYEAAVSRFEGIQQKLSAQYSAKIVLPWPRVTP